MHCVSLLFNTGCMVGSVVRVVGLLCRCAVVVLICVLVCCLGYRLVLVYVVD